MSILAGIQSGCVVIAAYAICASICHIIGIGDTYSAKEIESHKKSILIFAAIATIAVAVAGSIN